MAKTIFLFYTVCTDPGREQELSDWYDDIHIPDVEAVPGFTACVRYELTDEQLVNDPQAQRVDASYLSIVEADLDLETAKTSLADAVVDWQKRGRMTDLFKVVSSSIITETNPSQRSS